MRTTDDHGLPETDSMEFSNMADHYDAEQRFRQDTLAFIRQCFYPIPLDDVELTVSNENLAKSGQVTPGSGNARSSTSSSPAAEASSNSSSPSIGTSTEDPSLRLLTATPNMTKLSKRGHNRAASLTKAEFTLVKQARRLSASLQAAGTTSTDNPEAPRHDNAKSQPEGVPPPAEHLPTACGGSSHRMCVKNLASTIAKYFRPRKDSAVEISGPELILEETRIKEEAAAGGSSRSPLILSFKAIADRVCPQLSPHEHQRFLQECEKFIAATEHEQKLRVRGVLPGVEEYIAMRMDTGGVAICVAMHE